MRRKLVSLENILKKFDLKCFFTYTQIEQQDVLKFSSHAEPKWWHKGTQTEWSWWVLYICHLLIHESSTWQKVASSCVQHRQAEVTNVI